MDQIRPRTGQKEERALSFIQSKFREKWGSERDESGISSQSYRFQAVFLDDDWLVWVTVPEPNFQQRTNQPNSASKWTTTRLAVHFSRGLLFSFPRLTHLQLMNHMTDQKRTEGQKDDASCTPSLAVCLSVSDRQLAPTCPH